MPNMNDNEISYFKKQAKLYRERAMQKRQDRELRDILEDLWSEDEDTRIDIPAFTPECAPTVRTPYSR